MSFVDPSSQASQTQIEPPKRSDAELLADADREWEKLAVTDPEFLAYFDDIDASVCLRSELMHLIRIAKTEQARLAVHAIFNVRLNAALACERTLY